MAKLSNVIDIKSIIISEQAKSSFIKLSKRDQLSVCEFNTDKDIRILLEQAEEDNTLSEQARVRRIINSGFHQTSFWIVLGWRFVIREERNYPTLVTCERILV